MTFKEVTEQSGIGSYWLNFFKTNLINKVVTHLCSMMATGINAAAEANGDQADIYPNHFLLVKEMVTY